MDEKVEMPFAARVWDRLSKLEVETEKKGRLSYVSWSSAWGALMGEFPESSFEFEDTHVFDDGTCEVWVSVTVRDGENEMTRRLWLPVLDHRNSPVVAPTSMQINTTRMRCLTKALAFFGLALYVYQGESAPHADDDAEPSVSPHEADRREALTRLKQRVEPLIVALEIEDYDAAHAIWSEFTDDQKQFLYNKTPKSGGTFTHEQKGQLRQMDRRFAETGSPAEQMEEPPPYDDQPAEPST